MSDYTFMNQVLTLCNRTMKNLKKNAATVIVTYAEHALRTAGLYVSHHKTRNGVTPEDIKRAMMMEMFLFNNRPNLLEKAQEIREVLFGIMKIVIVMKKSLRIWRKKMNLVKMIVLVQFAA